MAGQEAGERTEQATPKRMKEVRAKGQLSRSQDLTAWVGVGAVGLMLPGTVERGARAGSEGLARAARLAAAPEPDAALRILGDSLRAAAGVIGPLLAVAAGAVLAAAALQGGIHLKKFKGEYQQFNLVTGLKRTFGGQALWQGAKALLKTAALGLVLYLVVQGLMPILMTAGGLPVSALLDAARGGVAALLQAAVAAGLVLAAADILVVLRRNRRKTRMTRKEVRDENKNSEGDPLIRSQRRARQLAMSRNRMIAAVGDADVVVVNPTHVAVALRYEPGRSAPRVTAKGAGVIAARIRAEAKEHRVPMVRDVPLARTLHATCDLGQEIPPDLYAAVAQVLAFVFALRQRGAAAGEHTLPPQLPPRPNRSPGSPTSPSDPPYEALP